MSKLFDEEDEFLEGDTPETNQNVVDEDDDEESVPVKTFARDKIFDNDYNTGNLDFEEYSNLPRVDSSYAEDNLRDCYDSYEYTRKIDLEKTVDEYFKNTEHGKVFANKKKFQNRYFRMYL